MGDEDRASTRRNNAEVARVGPGADLGSLAPLDGALRSAKSIATDRVAALLGARVFATLHHQVPEVIFELLADLTQHLRCSRDALGQATRMAASA